MSKEKSEIAGGGTRITEHVDTSDMLGNDRSYVTTNDYDEHGNYISSTRTDHNGDIWNTDQRGIANEKIGNDGRND